MSNQDVFVKCDPKPQYLSHGQLLTNVQKRFRFKQILCSAFKLQYVQLIVAFISARCLRSNFTPSPNIIIKSTENFLIMLFSKFCSLGVQVQLYLVLLDDTLKFNTCLRLLATNVRTQSSVFNLSILVYDVRVEVTFVFIAIYAFLIGSG